MNRPSQDSASFDDAIDTAAAEWLCEREEGFASGRAEAFAAWRAADPRHEEAVRRTETALALMAEMPAIRQPLEAGHAEQSRVVSRAARWSGFHVPTWLGGLAAALVLGAGLWWLGPDRANTPRRYATPAARQQQIALNDGSVVDLNVSSDVRVRLTATERRITVATGEAHFAVAHDTTRPFIVTAAGVAVRAVGTAFSVSVGDAGVTVLVTEGKVELTRDAGAAEAAGLPLPAERPTLIAGERTVISRVDPAAVAEIERVSANALTEAVRWHSQRMTFSDLPLRDAVRLFNRRNEIQLVLADAELGERKIGGTFAADQVEAFVRLLERDGDVVSQRRSAREISLLRAP